MRVIAGSRRSIPLKTVPGLATRPTTDRIKETLFNILNPYLPGSRFLDVFAGSGGIGIEALSRGAAFCCFVEQSPAAAACIRENLKKTDFLEASRIIQRDARNPLYYRSIAGNGFFLAGCCVLAHSEGEKIQNQSALIY